MYGQRAVEELHKAFKGLNDSLFGGKLEDPVIVILSTHKKQAYGWFTPDKIWVSEGDEVKRHEIAIGAEYLRRTFPAPIETLLHEMIHLHCHMNGIKDTVKKNKYHTDRFKDACEAHGMDFIGMEKPHDKFGWCWPTMTEETKKLVDGMGLDQEAFKVQRMVIEKKKKPKQVFKYMCPGCEAKVRVRKELDLHCNECEMDFVEY